MNQRSYDQTPRRLGGTETGTSGQSTGAGVEALSGLYCQARVLLQRRDEHLLDRAGYRIEFRPGKSRRGKPGSDNELIIDAVAPYADYIVVTEDGNFDGRFTDIAKKSHARISVIKNSSELTTILQKLFLSK